MISFYTVGHTFFYPNMNSRETENQMIRGLFLQGRFEEVLQETERLADCGQDSSYLRLCRAGAYLWLGQQEELFALIDRIKEPRYHQATDVYELYRQTNEVFDMDMRNYCFGPLALLIDQGTLEQGLPGRPPIH